MSKRSEWLFLFVVLIIAAIFRLWQLDKIPPGLYPDVAIYANDAFLSLKNKDFKVFYPENYGREGLWMWLLAFSFSVFGVSIWTVRVVAAIVGILTVLGLYILTKELFSGQKFSTYIALLSSFFLATSFWHTNFSRIGFRVILLPFVLVFVFYFLLRALKEKSIFYSILAGIFFGLGFYTYTSFRMAVLILPIFLIFWFLYKKEEKKKFILIFFVFLTVTFFVALPLGIYFLKHPEDFVSRAAPITIFSSENPPKEFLKSLILHLGMFNIYGDPNWRHNFAKKPMLFWPVGIFFLIGFILTIKNSLKFKKNLSSLICNLLLIVWFLVMLLPGILTREGVPHSLRVSGVIPVVFIFSGIGAFFTFEKLKNTLKNEKTFFLILFSFLIICAFFDFQKYFFIWAKKPQVESEHTKELSDMGNYLNSLPEEIEKYVIVNLSGVPVSWAGNLPMPSQTLIFLEFSKYGKTRSTYILPEEILNIKIKEKGVILPLNFDEKIFEKLKEVFPQGQIKKINNFYVYEVEK